VRGLFDSLALKAVSFALALVLWFVISGEKSSERGLRVPLELQNFPRDLELTGEPVDWVEVRVRASPGIIQRLTPADISAHVDLAGTVEGERIVHITESSLRLPFGVKVVQVNPSTLTLAFERTVQKTVPIRPRLLGRPNPAYEVGEITSDPRDAHVAGPRSRVQELESAFTEPVSVEGAAAAVVAEVTVGLEDPLLRLVEDAKVRVTVQIQERLEERALSGVPVTLRGGEGDAEPAAVTVILGGPASVLRTFAPSELRAFVDAAPAGQPVDVIVEIGPGHPGLVVKRVEPQQVGVRAPRARRKG
jgi:hypothetical protein